MTKKVSKTGSRETGAAVSSAVKPPPLKAGDRVAIVAPASRPEGPHVVAQAVQVLSNMGFVPVVGQSVLSINGYMAGSDDERRGDLNGFIKDRSIRAIFCICGGYGSLRLLNKVDYASLSRDPKIIVGSDENTCLLLAISKQTGLVCFHGPNLEKVTSQDVFDDLKRAVTSLKVLPPVEAVESYPSGFVYSPVPGKTEGVLLGGNLTALFSLMGTRFEPDFAGKILFLEDKNERNDILERWMTGLFLSKQLDSASAILFGTFQGCGTIGSYSMLSLEDTFADRLTEIKKPSCFGMAIGQSKDCRVVPIGLHASADTRKGKLEFSEPALSK